MKTKYSDLIEIRESAIAFKIHPENGDWRDFIPNGQFNDVLRKAKPVPRPDMSIRHSQPTSSKRPELLHWQEPSRETRPSTVVRTYLSKHR